MKLLEKFETVARQRRLAANTIDAYRSWVQQFLRFSATARGKWTRPEELKTADVENFLNDLVSQRRLSASSQNQALNALVFLYSQVLDAMPEDHLGKFALLRSTRPKRVPTVLSGIEVKRVIEANASEMSQTSRKCPTVSGMGHLTLAAKLRTGMGLWQEIARY